MIYEVTIAEKDVSRRIVSGRDHQTGDRETGEWKCMLDGREWPVDVVLWPEWRAFTPAGWQVL